MEFSELQDAFDKTSFHVLQIGNHAILLREHAQKLGLEDDPIFAQVEHFLKAFYNRATNKYQEHEEKILRGDA